MGSDAYAYLYLAVKFDDVYETKVETTEYDIHDQKTGKKTGQKGTDTVKYLLNRYTGQRIDNVNPYQLVEEDGSGITEDNLIRTEQESGSYYLGVKVASAGWRNAISKIDDDKLEKARAEFEKIVRPLLGQSGLKPELILNLYWSY